ncbi:MAG: SpoIIE family protein phosphatase [Lachnospiraceae bacterium]|nr:SpoIIE family protein phosphatase [Lachnospiraceae bacterium]
MESRKPTRKKKTKKLSRQVGFINLIMTSVVVMLFCFVGYAVHAAGNAFIFIEQCGKILEAGISDDTLLHKKEISRYLELYEKEGSAAGDSKEYKSILAGLEYLKKAGGFSNASLIYCKDKTAYSVIDTAVGPEGIGRTDIPRNTDITTATGLNDEIFYLYVRDNIRYMASEKVIVESGNGPCYLSLELNFEDVAEKRTWFVLNSIGAFLIIGFVIGLINYRYLRRVASKPLGILTEAARNFAKSGGYTREDIIDVNIKSNNEIGVLYNEFRSMEGRIVDYTEEITSITAEKEHLLGQLDIAVRLKLNLMPNVYPAFPEEESFDLYVDMLPIEKIGGDFYDFFRLDRDHIAIVIADIFDGGSASALFMVAFKNVLTQFAGYGLTPEKTISAVSNRLYRDNIDNLTLSAWYGVYEISSGQIIAVSAGHEEPLVIGEKGIRETGEGGIGWVIGMAEDIEYESYSFTLEKGEALFLYTDGVTEAENPDGEEFGIDRLTGSIKIKDSAVEIVSGAQKAMTEFEGGSAPKDDSTMLCLLRRREVE